MTESNRSRCGLAGGRPGSLVEVSVRASNASGAAVSIVRADLTLDRGETTLLRASVDEKVRLPRRVGGSDGPHSGGNTF